jgi:hypothetical protein
MNNYENQREIIDAILNSNSSIAIDIDTNKITTCRGLGCSRCLFFGEYNKNISCYGNTIKWLVSECIEPEIDWSKVAVDTPVLVSDNGEKWYRRYFAGVDDKGRLFMFPNGRTSWSNKGYGRMPVPFKYIKLAEVE